MVVGFCRCCPCWLVFVVVAAALWICSCGSCYVCCVLIFAIGYSFCLRFLWFPFFGALRLFCVRVLRWVVCCGCCGFCDCHPAAVFEDVAVLVVAVVVEVWLVVGLLPVGLLYVFSHFRRRPRRLRPGLSFSCCCCCQCRVHNYTGTVVVDVNVTMLFNCSDFAVCCGNHVCCSVVAVTVIVVGARWTLVAVLATW